ncbi:MAG: T9SS type A sorting domain-containing protein [candidate division WOR-3 bacterium]
MSVKRCSGVLLLLILGAVGTVLAATPEQLAAWAQLPAGTEILELRTENARHYSNGNGTITAEIHSAPIFRRTPTGGWEELPVEPAPEPAVRNPEIARLIQQLEEGNLSEEEADACLERLHQLLQSQGEPPRDDQVTVYPQNSDYWSGYAYYYYGSYYKYSDYPYVWRGNRINGVSNGWVKFDISSISGSVIVTAATFYGYGWMWSSNGSLRIELRNCAVEPVNGGAQAIYSAIDTGTTFSSSFYPNDGWTSVNLNTAGCQRIADMVPSGYVTIGMRKVQSTYGYWQIYGHGGGSYRPYMQITYFPSAAYDVGVLALLEPPAVCTLGPYVPKARVRNYGTSAQPAPFYVKYRATGPATYLDSAVCPALAAGAETTVVFSVWNINTPGTYTLACSTMAQADSNRANDKKTGSLKAGLTKILILAAEYPTYMKGLADSFNTYFDDIIVDTMDAGYYGRQPPSVNYLIQNKYRAILTFANYSYTDAVALGETLAKYLESGYGGVVWSPFGTGYSMGRFTQLYTPMGPSSTTSSATLGTVHQPGHKIMEGVSSLYVGSYTHYGNTLSHTTAYKVADYTNGYICAACNDTVNRRVAMIGFFPTAKWYVTVTGQWLRMLKNALMWSFERHDVGVGKLCAPTGNLDSGQVVTPSCSLFNYGTFTENYKVRMKIGTFYEDSATVTGHSPNTWKYVTFSNWTARQRGNFTASCSTALATDADNSNDMKTTSGFVRVADAQAVSISSPSGTYPLGSSVTPAGTWRNNGNVQATYGAWVVLKNPSGIPVYANKVDVVNQAPGAQIFINAFPSHIVDVSGIWQVRCSTSYVGDMVPANNVIFQTFTVGNPDPGVLAILAPTGQIDTNITIFPRASFRNYGDCPVSFRGWFIMKKPDGEEAYRQYVDIANLDVGLDTTITYPAYNVGMNVGTWATRCSVYMAGDAQPNNNIINGTFKVSMAPPVTPGWREMTQLPAGSAAVKDGGWLAIGEERGFIYAAKGNKSGEFYRYNVEDSSWTALTSIPNGTEAKPPYKGAVGVCDNAGNVWATKGNNTLGFWRYDIDSMTWTQMPDVPLGISGKKVKGGTDMVFVQEGDTGWVYLLKGVKSDFVRFNTVSGAWDENLPEAPAGANAKWDKGSWLVYDGANTIYAHKAKYHELWTFSLLTHTWGSSPLPGMPLVGMMGKSKKSKDGGSAAWYDVYIYALKGGNTQELWRFRPGTGTWTELDTMPSFGSTQKKKRVKAGADIVSWGDGIFFALKGNKTNEFWRYVAGAVAQPQLPERSGIAGQVQGIAGPSLAVVPNPASAGRVMLYYSLPQPGLVTVRVLDVSGRAVMEQSLAANRSGSHSLDLSGLATGIYLVRLGAPGYESSQKLVIR